MKTLEYMTEPELQDMMNEMGHAIEVTARRLGVERPHFALVLFNDPKLGQCVTNCERSSMIEALRETADWLSRRQDVPR